MEYRAVPIDIDGLECTANGLFRFKGKPKKVTFCHTVQKKKATARLTIMVNGKTRYWQAAKLVAKTWSAKYKDDSFLTYKDGNIHNISLDNLNIVSKQDYWVYMQRNSGFYGATLEERKRKLENVIKEAGITLHYLKTKDISPLNEHVEKYLYPVLIKYCLNTIHLGKSIAEEIVPDCIARLYEVILNGLCMYNYERYCKKLLLNFKKTGNYGYTGNIPKPIKIEPEQLNLDCLCERYNVSKIKR